MRRTTYFNYWDGFEAENSYLIKPFTPFYIAGHSLEVLRNVKLNCQQINDRDTNASL